MAKASVLFSHIKKRHVNFKVELYSVGVQKEELSPCCSLHHFLALYPPLSTLLPYPLYFPELLHIYIFGYLSVAISNSQNVKSMQVRTLS